MSRLNIKYNFIYGLINKILAGKFHFKISLKRAEASTTSPKFPSSRPKTQKFDDDMLNKGMHS